MLEWAGYDAKDFWIDFANKNPTTKVSFEIGSSDADVYGKMTTDPRVVRGARVIEAISFEEASGLAYFGARVLHPMTLAPAIEKDIPVRVRNSRRPDLPGTEIRASAPSGVGCSSRAMRQSSSS